MPSFGNQMLRDGEFCGYSYLVRCFCQSSIKPRVTAKVSLSVSRRVEQSGCILFPMSSVPPANDLLGHILFAIRYEGINLQILSEMLPRVSEKAMREAIQAKPNGAYLRKAGYLWELFTERTIADITPAGRYIELFDSDRYFTDPVGVRHSRWHVIWNGLGTPDWCATVEKTPFLIEKTSENLLQSAVESLEALSVLKRERAFEWAYLTETHGSFALERETISGSRENRFISLLREIDGNAVLSEDFLCNLQNEIVGSPYEKASSFRTEQNWLSNGMRGAFGVRYVPPSPEDLPSLAQAWLKAANTLPKRIDPLVAAAVISFGFLYLHPFMDGNGRLSRFLIHQQLAASGALKEKMLLPVSSAIKKLEDRYFEALIAFSSPSRAFWDVIRTRGETPLTFSFRGKTSLYRYWDATPQTEFFFSMAYEAFELLKAGLFAFEQFDAVCLAVDQQFDIRQHVLHSIVHEVLDQHGVLSAKTRERFADRVPPDVFEVLEKTAREVLVESKSDPTLSSTD